LKVLVTGGGGFLGGAIVERLLERDHQVRSFARGQYPRLAARGVQVISGDLRHAAAVSTAVAGCDAVFHVAALPGIWGPWKLYHDINVSGTDNILAACQAQGVSKLVYTSTPSVVHAGSDLANVNESAPYAEQFSAHYPHSKAMAEKRVLQANGGHGLSTVALRPHLIWGPGDNHLVPRLISKARAGRLRLLGDGNQRVDSVYIDNAADAHLCALDRLAPDADCAGKPYFITQGEPLPIRQLINGILEAAGLGPVTKTIHPRVAWLAGAFCELAYGALRFRSEPPMTRFLAEQLSTEHWYDIGAARRDLGYQVGVSFQEGLARLKAALSDPG
jgi:nucleoside-diphosphate-sugar epimerase